MSKDIQQSKRIYDYLSGELSMEDKQEFEEELKGDYDLREQLAEAKMILEGIEGYAFKKMLNEFHNKYFNEKS